MMGCRNLPKDEGNGYRLIDTDKLQPLSIHYKLYTYNYEQDRLLEDSIRKYGILEPLVVAKAENGKYAILSGVRRWRIAKKLGIEKVPCIVLEDEVVTEKDKKEIVFHGNIQRKESCREMYNVYLALIEELNMNARKARAYAATLFGLSEGKMAEIIYVYKKENKYPIIVKALDMGAISLNEAYNQIRKRENKEILVNLKTNGSHVLTGNILEEIGNNILEKLGFPVIAKYKDNVEIDGLVIYGKTSDEDDEIRILVEYKNYNEAVSKSEVEKLVGAINIMETKPHITILIASHLTQGARLLANKEGIFSIEIGKQVTTENVDEAATILQRKLLSILRLA